MIFRHKIALTIFYVATSLLPVQRDGCASKKNTGDVIKITYNATGGRGGNYESLEITSDSLFFVQARRGNEKSIKQKTGRDFWNNLITSFNAADFQKIKSDPGHALYDGIDITITVETAKEKYSIVNGQEDTLNYKKIEPFTQLLEKKLEELRKKIVW